MRTALAFMLLLALVACTTTDTAGTADAARDAAPTQPAPETQRTPDVVVDMIARNWEFEPSEIRVKSGDLVRINVRSEDVAHGLAIEGYGQSVDFGAGGNATLQFVADRSGEFRFYCNVYCGQGHRQMAGRLIVE